MSSAVVPIPHAGACERAAVLDEDVLKAGRRLAEGGPVCFKLSSRVDTGIFPWWVRELYDFFCRKARRLKVPPQVAEKLEVPPQPAEQLEVYTSFARAVRECKTPDDQLLVMPFNRKGARGVIERAVECRPKDPTDAARTNAVAAVFAGYGGEGDDLEDLRPQAELVIQKCRDT